MRATNWTRGASFALALSICIPALISSARADRTPRTVASCTAFDQVEKDADKVELTIHSSCTIPLDCAVSWRVVCAPESRARRAVHPANAKFTLSQGTASSAEASAAVCGDASWAIDAVQWSCQPTKD
ncbi:MAG TPA: hypothetical protein VGC42_22975 [Kofleriaceae bacterium]